MISFSNTKIAYAHLNKSQIFRARIVFYLLSKPVFIRIWKALIVITLRLKLPFGWLTKPLIYDQFIGGANVDECKSIIDNLWNYRVYSLLYYSAESEKKEENTLVNYKELLNTLKFAIGNPKVAFVDFKPSGLVDSRILNLVSEKSMLNRKDEKEFLEFKDRVDSLCLLAKNNDKPIIIDSETSWIQNAIDDLADELMTKYNKDKAIVYRTFQMYRIDMLDKLFASHHNSLAGNYILGAKIVRGAYMDSERLRASKMGYKSPIHESKQETDRSFNEAVKFVLSNIDSIWFHCGTHNEDSIIYMVSLMESFNISKNDSRVFFSQLYGMSDNVSFNLADSGFNVVKYIPYGPLVDVIPYLMRRSLENTTTDGQTGREILYLKKELKRQKQESVD